MRIEVMKRSILYKILLICVISVPIFLQTNAPAMATETAIIYITALIISDVPELDYSGLLHPINPDGTSIFKLGRAIPVKFQLQDASGNFVSTASARIYLTKISNGVIGDEIEAESVGKANTGNFFRYDSTNNQYIFNLRTKGLSKGTWQIRVLLNDEASHYTVISLR